MSQAKKGLTRDPEEIRDAPRDHPLVRVHPDSGTNACHGRHASHIEGWPMQRGRALLARLQQHATEERFIFLITGSGATC